MINIIGAGLAGLSCAYNLAVSGVKCNLISIQPSERAQSVMAEGGINASLNTMGEHDTVQQHIEDTMRGGVYLADPNAVKGLCENAPEIVKAFADLGVPFAFNENGIVERNFGGQKKKRTAYVKSSTGKMLMTALIDEVRKYEVKGLVTRYSHHSFHKLNIENGGCGGVVVYDEYSGKFSKLSGSVVLATGGMNGLFGEYTTGTRNNNSDVTARVFEQGVELANLEFVQYHPTTIGIAGKRLLISEAARGEGGRLFVNRNGERWYFMEEKYPELKNLMPRDVVSAEIDEVTACGDCEKTVYLDMTVIKKDVWKNRLSDLREQCIHYLDIDPEKTPVPVEPGVHYFMGGIYVDENHKTSLKNLYAAGECACQYHGANRLGGNSLLGAVYGGKKTAKTIIREISITEGTVNEVSGKVEKVTNETAVFISETLRNSLTVMRDEKTMRKAELSLENRLDGDINNADRRRLNLALAMVKSAINRKESRGAHKRNDCADTLESFRKTTVARFNGKETEINMRDIPKLRIDNEI